MLPEQPSTRMASQVGAQLQHRYRTAYWLCLSLDVSASCTVEGLCKSTLKAVLCKGVSLVTVAECQYADMIGNILLGYRAPAGQKFVSSRRSCTVVFSDLNTPACRRRGDSEAKACFGQAFAWQAEL